MDLGAHARPRGPRDRRAPAPPRHRPGRPVDIHWPSPEVPLGETLAAMVAMMDAGRTRSIGLSNFPPSLVHEALEHAPILCNQVEYHPFLGQPRLRELAAEHDLLLTAYSPLARGRVPGDHTLREIAAAHGATPAQVALRWLVDQDRVATIPMATSPERIEENL
ncbi:MAG TPA: aldo/keto reductase, partial [Thermoleophilaceae bacterium]|nr:aldo/keto reductase [Thermoleophilaceae bacterium]